MQSRRNFIGHVASGLAGTLASSPVLGANSRIRLGIIGSGDRGLALMRDALACANIEFAGVADVYTRRLEEARQLAPNAKTFLDYRCLLEEKDVDAVLIATPQHLHGEHFVAALEAGKHVYQEKTMAFTVEEAKRMRAALQNAGGKHAVQVGHQGCSSGHVQDAAHFLSGGQMGQITAIRAHMYRNTPRGKPQWSRLLFPDMTAENILWKSFLGDAPAREFDPHRYLNWRCYADYSGGNVTENMCQQISFWYKVLNLEIPRRVQMTGGLYLWKDGREVPDTMSVLMEHAEDLLFSWDSGFGNNHLGVSEDVLGTDGTITRSQQIRYAPQKVNRPDGREMLGRMPTAPRAHMQNFLDCVREGKAPNCPFDLGYRVSIACRMAVDSYRLGRAVAWDPEREEIV